MIYKASKVIQIFGGDGTNWTDECSLRGPRGPKNLGQAGGCNMDLRDASASKNTESAL